MHLRSGIRLLFCAALLIVLGNGLAFAQGTKVTPENRSPNETERDNPRERARWFLRGRTVDGRPAPELLHKAYQQKLNNRRLRQVAVSGVRTTGAQTTTDAATTSPAQSVVQTFVQTTGGPSWIPLGPSPSGTASVGDNQQDYGPAIGRSTVVVVDQSDTSGNTVYLGGAAGGLWKSTNAANSNVQNCNTVSLSQAPFCAPSVTWNPLLDQQATLTVGAMAIRPGNNQWLVVGTGEANNSADSYYGLGFLVSQDGGATWTQVSTATAASGTGTIDLHGLGTAKLAFSTDNSSIVVASMAASSGGLSVGAEFGGSSARGLYFSRDAGLTWQRATVSDGGAAPDPGSSNSVLYNPFTHLFYANIRYHGFYSSSDGQNWTRLSVQPGGSLIDLTQCPSTTLTSCPLYRAEMTIVPGRAGSGGKGEMYVWIVDSTEGNRGMFKTLDGGASWTAMSTTGIDSCGDSAGSGACGTDQGTYNLSLLAVPNGSTATDLYAGSVNQYRCNVNPISNPTCATTQFANLTHTYGACGTGITGGFAHVHPDQHGIDFSQGTPQVLYFANDGGVYRTLNGYDTRTQTCNGVQAPWIQYDNLSGTMGSMIQAVWFSQSPADANILLAGTQDNGTMGKNSGSPTTIYGASWQSVNNGDGGFNDINPISPQEWFASNPNVSIQQCINSSGITCTANTFNEIVSASKVGGDSSSFYMPYMLDPQAANHLLVGTCRLWRVDRTANLATTWPSSSPLTFNLDEFSTAGTDACAGTASNQVNIIAAGGPCKGVCNSGTNGSGNGSQVIYVGTTAGKLFVTTNADGGASTWLDRSSGLGNTTGCSGTGCPISGIAIEPTDPTGHTAYVTVMGFKTGHVFKTTNAGASWTNIDGNASTTGLPDNPVDAVVVDPNQAGLIYVGTDVGVFKSVGDGVWTEVGPSTGTGSLPNVATTALHVFGTGANTRLRVSTYGRGLFDIPIPNTPGFQLALTPTSPTVNIGTGSVVLNGSITPFNNYTSVVNLQCTSVPANVTCTPSVASVNTSSGTTQNFTVTLAASAVGTYNFSISAVGTDSQVVTQQQPITLTAVIPQGLSLSAPATANATTGNVASTSFNLNSLSGFSGPVTLACTGLPATAGPCTFAPANPSLTAGGTVNVTVNIPTGTTPASSTPYSFNISASSPNSQTATAPASLLVTDFSVTGPQTQPVPFTPTFNATFHVTVSANPVFTGIVSLSCQVPSTISATNGCTFSPAVADLSASTPSVDVFVTTNPTLSSASAGTVAVVGSFAGLQRTANVSLSPSNASALQVLPTSAITPSIAKVGQQLIAAASVKSNYSTNVTMSCTITPTSAAGSSTCTLSPSSFAITSSTTQPVSVTLNSFGGLAGNMTATVTAKDSANATIVSTYPFTYSVTDYTVTAGAASAILPGGSTSLPVTLAAQNGYTGTVNAACNVNGAPVTCTLSPVGPYAVSGPTTVTATIAGPGSSTTTASGNYNLAITTSDAGFPSLAHNATVPITVQDYKIQTATTGGTPSTSATVTAGNSTAFVINVVPQAGGFSGTVNFSAATVCSGLPSKTTCTLNSSSAAAGGAVTVTIQTTAATTASLRPGNRRNGPILAFWTMLPGAVGVVLVGAKRRKRGFWVLLALTFALLIVMTACGGGGGGSTTSPPPTPVPGTPAGSYTVTLTSTSGSGSTAMTRTAQVTLVVQ